MSNNYKGNYEDFLRALGYRESSGRYNIENRYGYLGKYQMGEMALKDAGYYKGDSTPRKNDWIGEWTGKDGVWSKEDFLNNPQAQENAIREYHRKVWKYIKALGLDKYVGRVIGGVLITESGLLGGAHLVGVMNLKRFLNSNGQIIPKDGNNVPITHYIELLNGYNISEITGSVRLTPQEKDEILSQLQWDYGSEDYDTGVSTPQDTTPPSDTTTSGKKESSGGIFGVIINFIKSILSIFKK
jgi:hypothetical protein